MARPKRVKPDADEAPAAVPGVGVHELAAISDEAFEAYDMQGERMRFDTVGRRWTFRLGKINGGESVLELIVERAPDAYRVDTISTALLASEMGRPMVADVVKTMHEALA